MSLKQHPYEYDATVTRVVDADTIVAAIDLGFYVSIIETLRLHGINAPEHRTTAGDAATAALTAKIPAGTPILVVTRKDKREKYGRMLASVVTADGTDINAWLVTSGHARAWDGKGTRPTA